MVGDWDRNAGAVVRDNGGGGVAALVQGAFRVETVGLTSFSWAVEKLCYTDFQYKQLKTYKMCVGNHPD